MSWIKDIWNSGYGVAFGAILAVFGFFAHIPFGIDIVLCGIGIAIFVIEGHKKGIFD